jgi:hypothetical protein
MAIIYALLDPSDYAVRYVGYALDGPKRLESHLQQSLKARGHKAAWIRSLRVRGERPIIVTLEDLPGDVDWRVNERWWIARMRELGCDLTNTTDGGEGGYILASQTPEARAKRTASNKGRKRSEEFCRRNSERHKGQVVSAETRAKISATMTGRTLSEETKAKVSASLRGKAKSPEHIESFRKARQGEGAAAARLTEVKVREIRARLVDGERRKEIAALYGVATQTVTDIALRRRWKHI